MESFNVVKSMVDNKNIGINYICGSVTPESNYNPSFTLIEMDEEYMIPLNFKTYYLDLAETKSVGYPTWKLQHDFISEYGIPDVGPDGLNMLAE
jgi:hypothetical protein